jgi:NTE family protein
MRRKRVALALQGGGSHGAYTWGVLDRLLEEPAMAIEAVSGASAGAMNGVVLAHGHSIGGHEGAREALEAFWNAVSAKMGGPGIGTTASSLWPDPAKAYVSMTRYFSPYQLNPLNVNPLRAILAEQVDFERLRKDRRIRLFVSATRVRDGALRIFTNEDLTLEALLASASIPSMHHSVEVDGEAYWDGGLTANPPLSALVYGCKARDVLVVVLNAAGTDEVPSTAAAIHERFTQVSFSSSLGSQLQSIALAKAEADRARICLGRVDRRLRALRLHIIDSAEYLAGLDPLTRLHTDLPFVTALRDEGRRRAELWLRPAGAWPLLEAGAYRGDLNAPGESKCPAG